MAMETDTGLAEESENSVLELLDRVLHTGVVLVLDNGTTVYAARDAEGNDAGALHGVSKSGEGFVLPEILGKT